MINSHNCMDVIFTKNTNLISFHHIGTGACGWKVGRSRLWLPPDWPYSWPLTPRRSGSFSTTKAARCRSTTSRRTRTSSHLRIPLMRVCTPSSAPVSIKRERTRPRSSSVQWSIAEMRHDMTYVPNATQFLECTNFDTMYTLNRGPCTTFWPGPIDLQSKVVHYVGVHLRHNHDMTCPLQLRGWPITV